MFRFAGREIHRDNLPQFICSSLIRQRALSYLLVHHVIQETVEREYQVNCISLLHSYPESLIVLRHFTPAWHTVIMGTGAVSALIHNFPYGNGTPVIRIFTLIIFFLNLVLFILISGATAARYALFPDVWSKMMHHPAQSLFVGAAPMGFATLINIALVSDTRSCAPSTVNLCRI